MMLSNNLRFAAPLVAAAIFISGCGLKRHKYDNPITKDTQQPDKVLFDKAINDIEHSRFEIARLLLQNLINTYDTSEYLAKAKLAIADAWYREGGAHGLANAEAEYKDFILFYPAMEEAAEAQNKVCDIHYKQMEKSDRDSKHALFAEQECKQLLVQFPNSKFAPEAQQKLREIQEVLAEGEFRVGMLYQKKGSVLAAANRLQAMTDQFPLYSKADEGLWQLATAYHRAGDKFEEKEVLAYQRIVRDYPLSIHAEDARAQLEVMKRPVPEADPVALNRMKYEMENRTKRGFFSPVLGAFSGKPDVSQSAKSGTPPMEGFRPTIPASVPAAAANPGGVSDVTISTAGTDAAAIENAPDVRANPGAASGAAPAAPAATPAAAGTTPAAPAAAEAPANPKAPDPDAVAKQATMTPAQQKKAFAAAVKQQQDAARKAAAERKKREAQQAQLVKEQKKKSKQKQQEQKDQEKQPDKSQPPAPPAATGQGAPATAKQ
ncbi:MAG TPA: outer membrane protein assembly factor BamD [Candidatus Acidoferrales bacterium]|nr:outer membrane protein assembly factor BamD [Candidatus Acidoferrales bacterium]